MCILRFPSNNTSMKFSTPAIIILVILFFVLILLWLRYQFTLKDLSIAKSKEQRVSQELNASVLAHQYDRNQLHDLKIDIASLESEHSFLQKQMEQYRNDTSRSNEQFQLLASKILDEKSAKMEHDHNRSIKEMLDPLKERIKIFENRIEQNTKEDIARHSSLKEQIIALAHLNERMTLETTNLTKALKGDNKMQGNWGELILENILQKSGLEKDREYLNCNNN